MHPIAFRDYLWEVRKYTALTPGTKAYKKAFAELREKLPDADTFNPHVKKWERVKLICLLLSLAGFLSLIVLCAVSESRSQELFPPVQQKICFGLLVLFFLPEVPMLYAHFRAKRLANTYMEWEVRHFGDRLALLSDEEFARVQALLNNNPEYFYGDEPPMPGDTCGCYECGHIFPADNPEWDWSEDIPICPRCGSPLLAYGSAEVPVEKETLLLIHNLLFEEK